MTHIAIQEKKDGKVVDWMEEGQRRAISRGEMKDNTMQILSSSLRQPTLRRTSALVTEWSQ